MRRQESAVVSLREEECHHGVGTEQPAKQGRERKEWREGGKTMRLSRNLKVPKREISDRSDFPHFYTIKSLREGDFGVKIKKIFKNF